MRRPQRLYFAALLFIVALLATTLYSQQMLLLRNPSLSHDKIAFLYAGDIWTVSRAGGEAVRLTSDGAVVAGPYFSPDGQQVAFTAQMNGGTDVYIIPVDGGVPRRITWHPEGSIIDGWTPDGKDVVIESMAESQRHFTRLFRVHADGSGLPQVLPLPQAAEGAYSPDGSSMAYVPYIKWEKGWKRYVGGQTTPIWIVNMKTLDLVKVPRENSNDSNPVWVGDTVYFLSDREPTNKNAGPVSLWKYDTKTQQVAKVLENHGFDLKSFQAGPANEPPMLVVEQFGSIHLVDPVKGTDEPVSIRIEGELAKLTPHKIKVSAEDIKNAAISPTGARAVFEAHGEIFTVPAEKGDTRNLTNTPGAAERDPSWSPDGKTIAYFSDASGEYQLYLEDQSGLKPPTVIDLGPNPTYFYSPTWSPDSKHIAYSDANGHLLYIDVPSGKPTVIDTSAYLSFGTNFNPAWSPDSKWIAYNNDLPKELSAVFLYSLDTHKSTQITDGMSDSSSPVFDANGKYLYFLASTDDGPSHAGIDLSGMDRIATSAPYVIVLSKDGTSPLPPESDDEKVKDETKKDDAKDASKDEAKDTKKSEDKKDADKDKKEDKEKPVEVKIDLDKIGDRILSLPIPPRNYQGLAVGKTGVLFLYESGPAGRPSAEGDGGGIHAIWKFTLDKRKVESVLSDLTAFAVSADGSKVLYGSKGSFSIAAVDDLKPGDGGGKPLNLGAMEMTLDLRAEWKQIYHETWRIERDFFYDPNHHGLDINKIEAKYRPYLDGVASRSELTYLSSEMLSEMTVGHMFMGGPYRPGTATKTGLLGARYTTENDRYKFSKIFAGLNWTPGLVSPLTLPGVNVHEGEYLLAVNGRELHAKDNLYSFFDGTAGKQTVLRVGPTADGKDARDVTVVPIDDEDDLRYYNWIEGNRHKVDELSGGKVAYVYMPNTGGGGFTSFNRYFYAQLDKQAVVLDERFNEGGYIADYMIETLRRIPLSGMMGRNGKIQHDPVGAIFGPKVMLINQNSGSGGDAMPWYFQKAGVGKLVGTRTWGGLVGIGGYPPLIDGGSVTSPHFAFMGLTGNWEVENHGIAPDVMVEELPKDVAAGHDVQLETGVKMVLDELKEHPVPVIKAPPYPNYHQNDDLGVK